MARVLFIVFAVAASVMSGACCWRQRSMIGGDSLSTHRHCRVIVTMRSWRRRRPKWCGLRREDNDDDYDDDDNGMAAVPGASDGDGPMIIICAGDDEYYYLPVCVVVVFCRYR